MKKYAIIFVSAFILTSCADQPNNEPTLQERAELFAEEQTKKLLYIPESYDPVETKIDSAYTSIYNDSKIFAAAGVILKHQQENFYYFHITERESKMLLSNVSIIKDRAAQITKEFCGWEVYHRCRAKDRLGNPDFITILYYTDNEFSDAIVTYSLDDDDKYNFEAYKEVIDCAIDGEYDEIYKYREFEVPIFDSTFDE